MTHRGTKLTEQAPERQGERSPGARVSPSEEGGAP